MFPANTAIPILTPSQAQSLELSLLDTEDAVANAIAQAGTALANALLPSLPKDPKILILAGKGHNTGDALFAAKVFFEHFPKAMIAIHWVLGGPNDCKLAVQKILKSLYDQLVTITQEEALETPFDLSLDGVLGMAFTPPASPELTKALEAFNTHPNIKQRIAIDVPSAGLFQADSTYAMGVPKTPLFTAQGLEKSGKIHFLDLGFFKEHYETEQYLLTEETVNWLKQKRPRNSDKRTFGHLAIFAGSMHYPGALFMTALGALLSGVGLVTAIAPAPLIPYFATQLPEVMWAPCPVNEAGFMASDSVTPIITRLERVTAFLAGPGLGEHPDAQALLHTFLRSIEAPCVLDASALQKKALEALRTPAIFTPHGGEWLRICSNETPQSFTADSSRLLTLKTVPAGIYFENKHYISPFGGPILARGGAGDILSGLTGGLLAQSPNDLFKAASSALVWHGLAGDLMAQEIPETCARTTALFNYIPKVLYNEAINRK